MILKAVNILMGSLVSALMDEVMFRQRNGYRVSEKSLSILDQCESMMGRELSAQYKIIKIDLLPDPVRKEDNEKD